MKKIREARFGRCSWRGQAAIAIARRGSGAAKAVIWRAVGTFG